MNATTNEIESALQFLDTCDQAVKSSPKVTFGSGIGQSHTMMIDLIDYIID